MWAGNKDRPSPWMLVAVVAVAFAMVGTAVAGTDAISKLTKSSVKKIADKEIAKKAGGLSVSHAASADSATTATNATNATNATTAASAQPVAFAHVSSGGVLDAANSKNVGAVTKIGTALYCFSGLPFTPRGVVANVDFSDATPNFALTQAGTGVTCPGQQALVSTFQGSNPSPAKFYVVFYG
jgi:hypothetical protein